MSGAERRCARRRRWRRLLVAGCVLAALAAGPRAAFANCNLIPALVTEYPSTAGSVDRALAAPGDPVTVRRNLACEPGALGFPKLPDALQVTLRFEALGAAPAFELAVAPALTTANCGDAPGARCDTLRFALPDTDAALAPAGDGRGYTGPATIVIRDPAAGATLAEVGPLFEPTRACGDRVAERVFQHFTVLPRPNSFTALQAGGATALATVDGGGNLLLPLDFRDVLVQDPAAPLFRLLQGTASIPAFAGAPAPISVPGPRWVRSYTTGGRPIPPVLGALEGGAGVFGSVDAPVSVVRIARFDPDAPGSPAGGLYELRDRLAGGHGPLVIEGASASGLEAARLSDLASSEQGVAFAVDEAETGVPANGDGDAVDRVPTLVAAVDGATTNSGLAGTELHRRGRVRLPLAVDGSLAAFLSSEQRDGDALLTAPAQNGDGDDADSFLRVFFLAGGELSPAALPADPAPVVDGEPFALADGFVFFRTREADLAVARSERVSRPDAGGDTSGGSLADGHRAVSADGGRIAFSSDAPDLVPGDDNGLRDVFVRDRIEGYLSRVEPGNGTEPNGASRSPTLSRDGQWLAFVSEATNLAPPGIPIATIYAASLGDGIGSYRRLVSDALGDPVAADHPVLSEDGRWLAFAASDDGLGQPGDGNGNRDVYVLDRDADGDGIFDEPAETAIRRVSIASDGATSDGYSDEPDLSADGRFVVFSSSAGNLAEGVSVEPYHVYRHDRDADEDGVFDEPGAIETVLVSRSSAGAIANAAAYAPAITGDGRLVAFVSEATNLGGDDDPATLDVFVRELASGVTELVSASPSGVPAAGFASHPVLSDDGRWVAFESVATAPLVPRTPGTEGPLPQVVVKDRLTGTTRYAALSDGGVAADAPSFAPDLSADGRVVVFTTAAATLADGDANDVDDVYARGVEEDPDLRPDLNADGDGQDTVASLYDAFLGTVAHGPAASRIATQDAVALALVPERAQGFADANGDGDADDEVAALLLPADGLTTTSTGVAADDLDLGVAAACLRVPERGQGDQDLNGDGDRADGVLHVAAWPELYFGSPPVNSGLAVDGLASVLAWCLAVVPEAAQQGAPRAIGNGDGDLDDRIGQLVLVDGTLGPALDVPVEDFVVDAAEQTIAWRSCEADSGPGLDLNRDGDTADCVMQYLDVATFEQINAGWAAVPCDFPACATFFEPYRLRGQQMSFPVREADQSGPDTGRRPDGSIGGVGCLGSSLPGQCDLNGDGDADDTVIVVWSARTRRGQIFPIAPDAPPGSVVPFPETILGRDQLRLESDEQQVGQDCNGDGDLLDPCVLLVADSDNDGVLDEAPAGVVDNAPETANPDQTDADGDGLWDEVDPDPTTPAASACDADRDGDVDSADVQIVFGDRGMTARADDPRDPDRDGQVTVLDAGRCVDSCTHPDCTPSQKSSCGLGGELALGALGWAAWRRRRRAGAHPTEERT